MYKKKGYNYLGQRSYGKFLTVILKEKGIFFF